MKSLKRLARLNINWTEESWAPKVSFARFAVPVPRLAPLPLSPVNHRCYSYNGGHGLFTSRGSRGFTLIELLVVIGIIAILAGILLPTIAAMKKRAKIQVARAEMANLIAAINAYETEYSRPPASPKVEAALTPNLPDFTYGTVAPDGSILKREDGSTLSDVRTGGGHESDNRTVINVIMDRDLYPNMPNHARNPRRHVTFQAKPSSGPGFPGVDGDGILRDPWGNPYIITVDMNDDNRCQDGFYFRPPNDKEIPGPVAAWSLGPDGQADRNTPLREGVNRDNVLSWK